MPRKKAAADAASDSLAQTPNIENLALTAVMDAITGKFGKGSVMLAGVTDLSDIERIPTGHKKLDEIMGGGTPRGRIIEILGEESSGKSTLALEICASVQRAGFRAAYIDVEHALDPVYARDNIGLDLDSMPISQPNSAEEALEICKLLVNSGAIGVVVVDSISALVTEHELEGDVGDKHVSPIARLMSDELRKINIGTSKSKCIVIFINQMRSGIGPVPFTTTSGGRALKFYASIRFNTRRRELIEKIVGGDKVPIGQLTEVKNIKNKVAPPHRKFDIQIDYPVDGQRGGLNYVAPLVDAALDSGLLKKSGSWFALDGQNIAQGRPALLRKVAEDPELRKALEV